MKKKKKRAIAFTSYHTAIGAFNPPANNRQSIYQRSTTLGARAILDSVIKTQQPRPSVVGGLQFAMEYVIRFAQVHETFRRPEIEALAALAGIDLEILYYDQFVCFSKYLI